MTLALSSMNLGFLGKIPWFNVQLNMNSVPIKTFTEQPKRESGNSVPIINLTEQPKQESGDSVSVKAFTELPEQESGNSVPIKAFTELPEPESGNDPKLSFLSLLPWGKSAGDKFQRPSTINKGLKRQAQSRGNGVGKDSEVAPIRFRPYVCKVPWHTGVRAFLSQLFPRYGHYCGPNWSSGKDGGSLVWDRRPIDWLDFCCYCHDIGYDTHDQAKLLKADLAFLECLEKQHGSTKGDPHVAHLYQTMCMNGMPWLLNFVRIIIQ